MIQVNRIYLIFNRLVTKKFLVDTSGLPYKDGETEYRYVVTALDRLHNESAPMMSLVKL